MKALILAAGYAIRLYPLTENQPKPLLKIAHKPIVEHILEKIKPIKEIDEVIIATNARFHHNFQVWLNSYSYPKAIKLINDGTLNNEDRLGAVGEINYILKEEEIKDSLLVIAGDNLFGFQLAKLLSHFSQKNKSTVAFHDLKEVEKVKSKYGVGILEGSKVVGFEEKPIQPKSTLASTACYVFHKSDLPLVEKAIAQGKADNPGDLVKFLVKYSEVHGFVFNEHWFDVGSFESLNAAEELYSRQGKLN